MMNGYCFDAAACSLTISPSFAKKASVIGSREYDIIVKARKENPGLKVIVEKKAGKAKLTYAKMEEFIRNHHDSETLMKQYEGMRFLSKFKPSPYTFMKNWFKKTFSLDNLSFDADGKIVATEKKEAAKEIKAALTVEPATEAAAA